QALAVLAISGLTSTPDRVKQRDLGSSASVFLARGIRRDQRRFHMSAELQYGAILGIAAGRPARFGIAVDETGPSNQVSPGPIFCAAYGGARRMGSGSLDVPKDNPFATLFDDHAPLRNAEEWLLLSDYAANKESVSSKKARAKAELARVKA